jgi:hypothetical protein
MEDRIKIQEKTLESFETLKYILEVKFGDIIREVRYNIMPGVNDEGLVDLEGDVYIVISYPEPDLSIVASRLSTSPSVTILPKGMLFLYTAITI